VLNNIQQSWAMNEPTLKYYKQGSSAESVIES